MNFFIYKLNDVPNYDIAQQKVHFQISNANLAKKDPLQTIAFASFEFLKILNLPNIEVSWFLDKYKNLIDD